MEGNLVTLDICDSWIVIIDSVSKKNHLMGMLISGGEIMLQMDVVADHVFGKKKVNLTNKRKKKGEKALIVWKKRSIFFTLPYWEDHV